MKTTKITNKREGNMIKGASIKEGIKEKKNDHRERKKLSE